MTQRADRLLYAVFACSGAAALVSEVSWSRQVGLALGNTADSAAVVLAAYFAGLAVGQGLGSRIARRVGPLVGYGLCELLAAAWGLAVPGVLATWDAPPGARTAWCFAVLLPATAPLGATFPLLAEYLSRRTPADGRRVSLAYAANTVGGVVGVLAASAGGLVVLGVTASSYVASGVCAGCGVAALVLARRGGVIEVVAAAPPTGPGWWAAPAALSGLATLALEVLYTRMFALVLQNSTYTFGVVVAVFLAALAQGAWAASVLTRWVTPAAVAAAAGGLGAVAVPASVVLFVRLTGLDYFTAGNTPAGYFIGVIGLVAIVVMPPVILLGMVLPAAFVAVGECGGRAAGRISAVNTLAAAAGALAASYLWVPWLGLWGAFGLVAGLLALPAVVAIGWRGRPGLATTLGAVAAAAIVAGVVSPRQAADPTPGEEVVRRWESAYGWIDVVRARGDGSLRVRENLHYRHGSTGATAAREYRQGRLPLLLHPSPREVAFLGLGTGLTAAPVVADRDVDRAVIVELIPEVVEAARLLGAANRGVVDHPKVEVLVDDARHYLRRTDRQFDVIVSDLFVPWESRAGYLYTAEHNAAVRHRLRPGGLFCQWVALYQVGPAEFELIADTFAAAFPVATLWWGQFDARYGMVALVGAEHPLTLDPAALSARWEATDTPPAVADPDLAAPAGLPDLYLGDWPARPGRRLNTDEHPRLEFAAPLSHRARRTLTGPAMREYFEAVLTGLPAGGVRFEGSLGPAADPTRRRESQRLSLFGSMGP